MSRRKLVSKAQVGDIAQTDGNRFPSPENPELKKLQALIEAQGKQISKLESTLAILLASSSRSLFVEGTQLMRCRCSKFATRQFAVSSRTMGTQPAFTCDTCEVHHAMLNIAGMATVQEVPIYGKKASIVQTARELNATLDRAYEELRS